MDKILSIALQKMKNGSHNAFMHDVEGMLTNEIFPSQGFEKLIETFNLALKVENTAMRVHRKSYLTDELVKLNSQREELYAGMLYHIESSLRHYEPDKREAAQNIVHIMKSIAYIHNTSNINRNEYLRKITTRIRKPEYTAIVESLKLQGWLNALDSANENYQLMWVSRFMEQNNKGNGNVRIAREMTDRAYLGIITRLNALLILNGAEEYAHFMGLLNVFIFEEKKSIAIREGWRRHKKEMKEKLGEE